LYDTVIIGKGPAGISAAIYLKRAGLDVIVIGKDGGTLEKAGLIENYYGFDKPVSGKELYEKGINQAKRLGINIITEEVVSVEYTDEITAKTPLSEYKTRTLLFALGKKKKSVKIKGIEEFTGKGISFCAVCDGFFYRNKKIAVIGSGKLALSEANYLKNIAAEVTLFTNGTELREEADGINIVKEKIEEIYGLDKAEGIKTELKTYQTDGIFVASGVAGVEEFAFKLGLATENGNIAIDKDFSTNIAGIFAAGDCTGGFLQVAKAVSDGANAANSIIKYLRHKT
jgi:thioredoxin reductase (NADPH)